MASRKRYLLSALTVVLVLSACAPADKTAGYKASETVRVSGSGTCLPLLRILTTSYSGGDVEFTYLPGLHSGGGIKGVANGDLEIGAVSRDLTTEEKKLHLRYTALSRDGLVVATHPSVQLDGLTSQQVRDIYQGTYANWNELGGPDLPITILDRNEDESAKIILRQYVLGADLKITPKAVDLYYEPDMIEGVQSTAGAIGYFSLGYGLSQDVPVHILKLDGVEPTVANIENGTYRVVRPLGVVTGADAGEQIDGFLQWARSAKAVELIKSKGFAPAE
ncbi:MAG: substrate-binding domain-containing protein [Actinomycetia bacterium]|nr:substrate-binding domain-containing protein [Actinomycetes bacterium]